jgi:UPF0271 protein
MPPSVQKEVKSQQGKMAMHKFDLRFVQPSEDSLQKVKDKSDELNSPTSTQDEESLALALDSSLPLVTDDKALQNLALHVEAEFKGFNTEEVSERRKWHLVCDNCGEEISSLPCPRCGSQELDRKRDQCS